MEQQDHCLELYLVHRGALMSYAKRLVNDAGQAEDVVQEAFIRLRAATATTIFEEPVAYLYRIVRNLALDLRRHLAVEGKHEVAGVDDLALKVPAAQPSPEAVAAARQEFGNLLQALDELPERTRIAVEMHRLGGFKLREIAAHLGISISTAQALVAEGVEYCQNRI
ncbi:MAG: sigma-70 family RNA polymerase sigma factor [Reyranella sp.]|nr:sigma-70 family RNA polymerase sigma factor [Reyranella sp.]